MGTNKAPKRDFVLDKIGAVHGNSKKKKKSEKLGEWVSYVHPTDQTQIITMNQQSQFRVIRSKDFRPYSNATDPEAISNIVFCI